MKKKFAAAALGAVFALASFGSVFAAEIPTQAQPVGKQVVQGQMSKHDPFANLDNATKAKVKTIFDQERAGTLTKDQVKMQLEALGIKAPERPEGQPGKDPFANLDDATKEKVKAIFDQERAGTLTREEAKTQLEALGIKAPADHSGDKQGQVRRAE